MRVLRNETRPSGSLKAEKKAHCMVILLTHLRYYTAYVTTAHERLLWQSIAILT